MKPNFVFKLATIACVSSPLLVLPGCAGEVESDTQETAQEGTSEDALSAAGFSLIVSKTNRDPSQPGGTPIGELVTTGVNAQGAALAPERSPIPCATNQPSSVIGGDGATRAATCAPRRFKFTTNQHLRRQNGTCLAGTPKAWPGIPSAQVVRYVQCAPAAARQRWTTQPNADGSYSIRSEATGLCLTQDLNVILLLPCDGGSGQAFVDG